MSARSWVTSCLFSFHLVAITLAAIPNPGGFPFEDESARRLDDDPVSARLTPITTRVAAWAAWAQRGLAKVTGPLRTLTQPYVRLGLSQSWNMFSEPFQVSRFVRIDYFLATSAGRSEPSHVIPQLVLPSLPDADVRLAYRPLDKAVTRAVDSYLAVVRAGSASGSGWEQQARARLLPMLRLFRTRFVAAHGVSEDRIRRTEVWVGTAPIPPPGVSSTATSAARRQILATYRAPQPRPVDALSYGSPSSRTEGDITWRLIYADQR